MNIIIVNPFGIGDCLFTTPLIHTLKDNFPKHKLGFLCNKRASELIKNNPYVDKLFIYERDEFKRLQEDSWLKWLNAFNGFIGAIKRERFDLAIDLSLAANFGFFLWLAGIKKRVGYNYKNRGFYLTDSLKLAGYENRHIVEYYNELPELVGIKPKYNDLELYLSGEDKRYADDFFTSQDIDRNNPVISIAPGGGASWGVEARLKRWPEENFRVLVDKIIEKYRVTIIILGDSSDKELFPIPRAIDLRGRTTLSQSAALINRADIFIGNDGGPLHMAVSLRKKTLSFFGPADPAVYGPYPPDEGRHIVLRRNLECSPCYRGFRLSPCARNRECLESIDVSEALSALDRLLINK
ncbi:glycosyltransferase family 9 protein [bacterium]|nr:MAG: glycosyltransferase family 9 protein [bacterium]